MGFAAFLAHTSHHGPLDPYDHVGALIELLHHPHDVLDIRLGGMRSHYDNHG